MKHNIITSIGLLTGAFILAQSKAIAQDQITKELLTRESGTWFSESTNAEGEKINHYSYLYYIDELEKLRSVRLSVDAETKKLIGTLHIFTGINKTGNQTEAIFFSSNGSVGKSGEGAKKTYFALYVSWEALVACKILPWGQGTISPPENPISEKSILEHCSRMSCQCCIS